MIAARTIAGLTVKELCDAIHDLSNDDQVALLDEVVDHLHDGVVARLDWCYHPWLPPETLGDEDETNA